EGRRRVDPPATRWIVEGTAEPDVGDVDRLLGRFDDASTKSWPRSSFGEGHPAAESNGRRTGPFGPGPRHRAGPFGPATTGELEQIFDPELHLPRNRIPRA